MSYQMCCRISTLVNNNRDQYGYLNFMVNGTESNSMSSTGLAREFFGQYVAVDYVVPVVHPNSAYSFSFSFSNLNPYQNGSGLLSAIPTSSPLVGTGSTPTCTSTCSTTCPTCGGQLKCTSNPNTYYVPAAMKINDGLIDYYGTGQGAYSTDLGRLLWTPVCVGLYATQVCLAFHI